MRIPTHLQHEPVIGVSFYSKLDGKYKTNTPPSDAKALSIGKAQYDKDEFSAKVFRHNDNSNRWSPQSEELPFHRVLDLAILLVSTIAKGKDESYKSDTLEEEVLRKSELVNLIDYLNTEKNELRPRLIELGKHIDIVLKNY